MSPRAAKPFVAQAAATLAGVAQQGADLAADSVTAGKLRLGLSGSTEGASAQAFIR